ncbi:STAS domain-containing protein [Kitasatospora purpeofusca]|uniref:STAS domain-containing protein n=1 Tax=Kitasatospora purpeofusca TaxID=67352 RepID=UPI002255F0E1|nr:STAS domain-containing protein [Kitasatospora purpeofusca]MCX4758622.1 STAS domain-containing protein [Kitasatospora purpeofusca]WSR30941.1 STAS domain-containing protein [Kitasatospora purpeofusca]
MAAATISSPPGPDWTVIRVAGELDLAGAAPLHDTLLRLVLSGRRQLIIDVSEVAFCDLSGFSVLADTRRVLSRYGGHLRVVLPPAGGRVHRTLTVLGFDTAFQVFPDLPAALAT